MTDRLDWSIEKKSAWFATYKPTGTVLVAATKIALMSKINEFEKELSK